MKKTQNSYMPAKRGMLTAAFAAILAVPAFATTGGGGLDLTGPIASVNDQVTGFITTNAGPLIGVSVTLGLLFLAWKWIRRSVKGGG